MHGANVYVLLYQNWTYLAYTPTRDQTGKTV